MNTRDKILTTARRLFNERGTQRVSAKNVAATLGISDGNLRYHFRTKEDLVYGLYMTLVEQLNQKFNQYQTSPTLSGMWEALQFTFAQFVEYRFLLLDFTGIMRQYSSIRTHYQALHQLRRQQFTDTVDELRNTGILRQDIPPQQYQHLATHFTIVSDFWLAHAEILHQKDAAAQRSHFTHLAFSLLFPYLTEAGQQEYQQLAV